MSINSCCCSRYDYEGVDSGDAGKVMDHLRGVISKSKPDSKLGNFTLQFADDFEYTDPVDGSKASKQGLRFVFDDGSRMIFRLSGTGSAGATIRSCPHPPKLTFQPVSSLRACKELQIGSLAAP